MLSILPSMAARQRWKVSSDSRSRPVSSASAKRPCSSRPRRIMSAAASVHTSCVLRLSPGTGRRSSSPAAASRSTWKETMPGFMPRNWHTSRAVLLSGLLAMKRRMSSASAGSSASRQSGCSTAWYASMKRLELLYILAAAILGSSICIHFRSGYFNIEQLDIIHFKIKKSTNIL